MQQKLVITRYKNNILLQISKGNWNVIRQYNDKKNMNRNRGSGNKKTTVS